MEIVKLLMQDYLVALTLEERSIQTIYTLQVLPPLHGLMGHQVSATVAQTVVPLTAVLFAKPLLSVRMAARYQEAFA